MVSYRLPGWLIVNPPTRSGQERDGHTPLTPLTTIGAMEQTADSDDSSNPPHPIPQLHRSIAPAGGMPQCCISINNWLHMRSGVQHSAARSMMRQHDG